MNIAPETSPSLNTLLDIPLEVTVEIASCIRSSAEVLGLAVGSVVEFEGKAADPVELLVNGKLLARGEIVGADGHWGIRITDVVGRG
jgi:flagellar motor switch protein FliN/FliY